MRFFVTLAAVMFLLASCASEPSTPSPASETGTLAGDAGHGAQIFRQGVNGSPPCLTCHQVEAGSSDFSLGPNLAEVGKRAETRIEGVAPEEYLHESILQPREHLVSGYSDIMYPNYGEHFSEQDTADLIAYLLTL